MDFPSFLAAARRSFSALVSPRVFAPAALLIYLAVSFATLQQTLKDPKGRADLVSGDAGHYLAIARDFAAGNFSMDYVAAKPHRQPLYPAALAPVIRLKGQDFFWMAAVNIGFAAAGLLVVHGAVLRLHGRPGVAAIVALLYGSNSFLLAQTTRHFLTEPLHILLMCGAIFAFLGYLRDGRPSRLFAAIAAIGLDYLSRPNGLFVIVSLLAALAVRDAAWCVVARRLPSRSRILRTGGVYALGVLLFIAITIPSWLPRWEIFGNPVHHGYLSNYLWVDTYAQGHVGQKFATYHWQDYVKTHTVWDAARRTAWGFWEVCFAIPFRVDPHLPMLFFLALAGVAIAVARGPSAYRTLALFGAFQLLPLIWTHLSNPTLRVPYAATMPFEIAFAALTLAWLADRTWLPWFQKSRGSVWSAMAPGRYGDLVVHRGR